MVHVAGQLRFKSEIGSFRSQMHPPLYAGLKRARCLRARDSPDSSSAEAGVLKVSSFEDGREVAQFRLASPSVQTHHDTGSKNRADTPDTLLNLLLSKLPYQETR